MQPQHRYLRKWTPLGLGLIAVTALMLSASASAVVGADQATAAPKYRVLIVTAGNKKDGLTDAGVNAIKAIGKDTGTGGKFSTFVAGNPEQITDQFTETNLARYRAVIFLGTGANALLNDAQKAAFESYFHNGGGFLGIGSAVETEPGWQFYSDILGAGLPARRTSSRRRSRSPTAFTTRRRTCPSTGTGPTLGTTSRRTSEASHTSSPRSSRIRSARSRRARCSTGSPAARWAPTIPSSGARTSRAAARSIPRSETPRAASTRPTFRSQLEGAIDWTAGVADKTYSDCGATVLANYQQTKIGQPNLSEPIGFDQLPDGRIIQTDRRGGIHLHDRHHGDVAGDHARSRSTTTARTGCTAVPSTTTSRPTSGSTCTTPRRTSTTSRTPTGRRATRTTSTRPPAGRTARARPRPSTSPTTTPGSGTSSCRGSSSSTTSRAAPGAPRSRQRAADPARPGQPRRLLPRGRRHRLRQAQQPLARRPATTAPQAAATPARWVRASTSGPTRTRPSASTPTRRAARSR